MSPQQITETLGALNQAMATQQPMPPVVSTGSCTCCTQGGGKK